jgi:hypothetical protein
MQTPPPNEKPIPSQQMMLQALHQKKVSDQAKRAKAAAERRKQIEMAQLIDEVENGMPPALKKPKVVRKLTFQDAESLTNNTISVIPPSIPVQASDSKTMVEEIHCYCDDLAKKVASKTGREFLVCPNSRWNNTLSKYESDCDFFLFLDQLIDIKCKCGNYLRRFATKDGAHDVEMCIYKNAPTVWKKLHGYTCNHINKM